MTINSTSVFYEDSFNYSEDVFPLSQNETSYSAIDYLALVEGYNINGKFQKDPHIVAVTKSGSAMIVMTSFVLFFSQMSFFITPLASFTSFPELSETIIKSLLEVSQACRAAAELDKTLGIILSAFSCAWSGISFQMQTFALGGKYFGASDLVRIAIFRLFTALSACAISALICKVLEIT
jgi:hypothetical protein